MRQDQWKKLLTGLIVCNLALIWGNSLLPGSESGAVSGGVLAWIGEFFPFVLTEAGHHFLRKAAHFSEFCLLGILTGARRLASGKTILPENTGWGLAAACIDETIQLYVPDRSGMLTDVWIDTAGFAAGLALAAMGHTVIRNKHKH